MPAFRLILDAARPAALNMAIDEILMESQRAPDALPALRFYRWSSPAATLGYFQDVARVAKRFHLPEKGIAVVRRPTGGGMVLHDRDLTFSLSMKNPNPFLPADVKASYLKINEALIAGLRELVPDLDYADCKTVPSGRASNERVCFESPSCYDVMRGSQKVVGASQRRRGDVMLHQSTVFLEADEKKVAGCIRRGFEMKWGVEFKEKPLDASEIDRAGALAAERYASAEWGIPVNAL